MKRKLLGGVACLAALSVAASAFAGNGSTGNGTGIPFKLPPLRTSDTISLGWGFHSTDPGLPPGAPLPPAVPGTGWAGEMVKIHVLDNTEVDVNAIVPLPGVLLRYIGPTGSPVFTTGPIVSPFGPASENRQSSPLVFTAWHPLAQQSGIDLRNSVFEHLFDLVLHVKNSTAKNNSDTDITMMFTEIWHSRPSSGSDFIHAEQSDHLWLFSTPIWEEFHIQEPDNFASNFRLPTQGPPIDSPEGHWVHVPQSITFHTDPGPGSLFWKRGGRTYLIGVEHVPEPATFVLLGLGLICAVKAVRSRGRRCSQA
jgi:hypothetical protein